MQKNKGHITIGPMGVGKSVTLMIFVLYLKYVLKYNVVYYNFDFMQKYTGVDTDLTIQILEMIYHAKGRNNQILKQAASIISRKQTYTLPSILNLLCEVYNLENVVLVIDQLNLIANTNDSYINIISNFVAIKDCYKNFITYACFSNNNNYVRNLINGFIKNEAIEHDYIYQITNCYNKESALNFILHKIKDNPKFDEITQEICNINALFLTRLADSICEKNEIEESFDQVCHDMNIRHKIKKFYFKYLTDIDLKLMHFINPDNNEIIQIDNIQDTAKIRIKGLLPQIRRLYINSTEQTNSLYDKMVKLYYDPHVPSTGKGLIFEYIFLKNMILYSSEIIRAKTENIIYCIQKIYSI
jgi:hypothetical protein